MRIVNKISWGKKVDIPFWFFIHLVNYLSVYENKNSSFLYSREAEHAIHVIIISIEFVYIYIVSYLS